MAKHSETINLTETFAEFKDLKNIDRATMMNVLEDVFKSLLIKKFGTADNCSIIINIDKGDFEIWRYRNVVDEDDLTDPLTQITITEAQKIDTDYEVGEEVADEVKLLSFGRRAILSLRQNLSTRIAELEKDNIYSKYKDRVGQIITADVHQTFKKDILLLDDEGNELVLPKTELIPGEYYHKGDTVKAVILKVDMKNNSPQIVLSRTSPFFLERMFELEVPEIFDGLITIRKIVRIPGERAKVAVESYDDRIDPVGACVGMKGSRIHNIVRELRNENIDVINYTNNLQLYISRALSPSKISSIKIDEKTKKAQVYLAHNEVSKAIGKGGLNIKLAGMLTGYEIDVYREMDEDEDDVDLEEFADEIDGWVIDEFKRIGCDTAKSVLSLSAEELIERTDLEEETIQDVLNILKSEFED